MSNMSERSDLRSVEECASNNRPMKGSNRKTSVRWRIILLCFLATTINFIDRTNISVAAPYIGKELHLNAALIGLMLSAFFWTYAVFQLPAGWLIDRFGPRIGYTFACVWWSIMTGLVSIVNSFDLLLGFRLLPGIGKAPAHPTNVKVASEWFPVIPLVTAGIFAVIGALSYLFIVRSIEPLKVR